jgi:hypothetical protein
MTALKKEINKAFQLMLVFATFLFLISQVFAAPVGPSSVSILNNETRNSSSAYMLNTSGGYITTINITANTQNLRWKGFVGYLTGKFSLDDAGGSTLYDWTLAVITGEVYATRNGTSISWASIGCATTAQIEAENIAMNHTNVYDNITATFDDTNNHPSFSVGSVPITVNSCNHTLNTYVNNVSATDFDEIALHTQGTIVYATILEDEATGFDGNTYDFQMIVPENGASSWTGSTAYYLYVELA